MSDVVVEAVKNFLENIVKSDEYRDILLDLRNTKGREGGIQALLYCYLKDKNIGYPVSAEYDLCRKRSKPGPDISLKYENKCYLIEIKATDSLRNLIFHYSDSDSKKNSKKNRNSKKNSAFYENLCKYINELSNRIQIIPNVESAKKSTQAKKSTKCGSSATPYDILKALQTSYHNHNRRSEELDLTNIANTNIVVVGISVEKMGKKILTKGDIEDDRERRICSFFKSFIHNLFPNAIKKDIKKDNSAICNGELVEVTENYEYIKNLKDELIQNVSLNTLEVRCESIEEEEENSYLVCTVLIHMTIENNQQEVSNA